MVGNKILIAEDEEKIRKLIKSYIVKEGYNVIEAVDGEDAINQFSEHEDIMLVILDVMMPKLDGYSVCRHIRGADPVVPILILTARDSEDDELNGFNCGADEYISKPFSLNILVTRVKNLLKRSKLNTAEDVSACGITIHYRERTVTVDEEKIILTPKEFELLHYLMRNKNLVLRREQILSTVWNYDYFGDDRTVDTHIKCIRAKLGEYGKHIVTLRKVGYKFEC